MRKGRLAVLAGAAVLAAGLAAHIHAQSDHESDHNALRQIAAAYETALNGGGFDGLMPYLADDLKATMATGEKVKSAKEFRAYFGKMKKLMKIGDGGTYSVKVVPFATDFPTDSMAVSFGTTDETIQMPQGKQRSFSSYWVIKARKEGASWKLSSGQIVVDPRGLEFSKEEITQISKLSAAAEPKKKADR